MRKPHLIIVMKIINALCGGKSGHVPRGGALMAAHAEKQSESDQSYHKCRALSSFSSLGIVARD